MKIVEIMHKDHTAYAAVKEVRGKEKFLGSVSWLPHPVCCGIGFIAGLSKPFVGLEECLAAAENRCFVTECQAMAMITSNVEEQVGFHDLLKARKWIWKIGMPNPIHGGREMTVWVKYNPDPRGAARRFKELTGEVLNV